MTHFGTRPTKEILISNCHPQNECLTHYMIEHIYNLVVGPTHRVVRIENNKRQY